VELRLNDGRPTEAEPTPAADIGEPTMLSDADPEPMEEGQQYAQAAKVPPAGKQQKPAQKAPQKKPIPSEEIAYPTDKQQQEIIDHIHTAELDQAVQRRKAAFDEMLKKLPAKGPRIKIPLPEDWRAGVNEINPTYAKLTEDAAKKYDIPPELLARLLHAESTYDRNAINKDGFMGIPQMGKASLKEVGVNPDTFMKSSAETQINAGAAYLAKQYAVFRDWPKAVAAYHHGRRAIEEWSNGVGPGYHNKEEREKPYIDYSGNLRVLTPQEIAKDRNLARWEELQKELPYVFVGDAHRYDGVGKP